MAQDMYYPCVKNWDTGEVTRKVGEAMTHSAAVDYLKQHHSGAWARANACPQPTSHPAFAVDSQEVTP